MEELLDSKQAAEFLNLSSHTLRTYVAWHVIPVIKLGRGVVRFRLKDLQEYLNRPGVQAYRRGMVTDNESK